MAYDKQEMEQEALKAIRKHKLMRFAHLFGGYVDFCEATAYNHKLGDLESIKNALKANRKNAVNYLLQKWISSENSTLQISAMKLVCDPEEREALSMQYVKQDSAITGEITITRRVIEGSENSERTE